MKRFRGGFAALVVAACVVGCGGAKRPEGAAGKKEVARASAPAAPADGGACGIGEDISEGAEVAALMGDPPAAQGGAITPGTYVLTKYETYGFPSRSPGGNQPRANGPHVTIRVSPPFIELATTLSAGGLPPGDTRMRFTYEARESTLTLHGVCSNQPSAQPAGLTSTRQYTATATQFSMIDSLLDGTATVSTFTKANPR